MQEKKESFCQAPPTAWNQATLFAQPNTPTILTVADKPLKEATSIHELTREQTLSLFAFMLYEDIVLDKKSLVRMLGAITYDSSVIVRIKQRLNNPFNLVTCHIDSTVGYGVFTREAIKKGDIVCLYAGQFESLGHGADYTLSRALGEHPRFEEMVAATKSGEYLCVATTTTQTNSINAALVGGIARFIQHMPYDKQRLLADINQTEDKTNLQKLAEAFGLEDLKMSESMNNIKKTLSEFVEENLTPSLSEQYILTQQPTSSANTIPISYCYQGINFVFLTACRDIAPNEQLGISYGSAYWTSRQKSPMFFNKDNGHVQSCYPIPTSVDMAARISAT